MLGCTARLAPPKDLITLLDALAQPGCERWELRVFGDGPDREAIETPRGRARPGRSRARCSATATTSPTQLADCDAFALISDWEGLPYSILEAMAAGLPVLATAVGGIADLVVPGRDRRARPAARRGRGRGPRARRLGRGSLPPARPRRARRTRAHATSFSREQMVRALRRALPASAARRGLAPHVRRHASESARRRASAAATRRWAAKSAPSTKRESGPKRPSAGKPTSEICGTLERNERSSTGQPSWICDALAQLGREHRERRRD